ncbi:division/cell wall cluster transcriptional repressor MraZ [Desulfosarcina sp. OttesenSCG-928-A07]|nr:division/cell wall cluster transcriptional repressor MraZ [Desulfosarcina sp. OttesenSCG-928-A07]
MGNLFRGSSSHTIDTKGRIIIPSRFRDVIDANGDDHITITRMDGCLYAYTTEQWNKISLQFSERPNKSAAMRRFERIFVGESAECKFDAQGRILIPQTLKEYAKLEKEIVLLGLLKRFEIWSKESRENEIQLLAKDLEDEAFRQEIAELDL